jgi:hypothetical protein
MSVGRRLSANPRARARAFHQRDGGRAVAKSGVRLGTYDANQTQVVEGSFQAYSRRAKTWPRSAKIHGLAY